MERNNERRVYQRATHFQCPAKVSSDGKNFVDIDVLDLSSGGLSFVSDRKYNSGDTLIFDLLISSFFSEFPMRAKGKVRRVIDENDQFICGISFIGLTDDQKIQIDESALNDRPHGRSPYTFD